MADWDAAVDLEHLADSRFAPLFKFTSAGPAWAVTRVKGAMRKAFRELGELEAFARFGVNVADELVWLVEGSRVELEACRCAVPQWCDEFEERVMAIGGMPKFEVRPAERAIRNVMIGVCGAAGGGKTCSALRLATGLAGGGDIVLIDTECGKATEFAPRAGERIPGEFDSELPLFRFGTIDLDPPFSPDRYRMAVAAAARVKPKVLIIDNFSDEMHGTGGQLDMKDAAPDSDKFGWIEPKRQHRALMNRLRTHPWYVILTIRAKEKVRPASREEKRMGAAGVVNEGWLPQCDGGLYFDVNMLQLVDGGVPNGATERPWKFPPALRRAVVAGQPLTEETGRRIAEWAQPRGTWDVGSEE